MSYYDDLYAKALGATDDPNEAKALADAQVEKESAELFQAELEKETPDFSAAVEKARNLAPKAPKPTRGQLVQKALAAGETAEDAEALADMQLEKRAQKAFSKEAAKTKPDFGAVTERAQTIGADVPETFDDALVSMLGPRSPAMSPMVDDAIKESMPIQYAPAGTWERKVAEERRYGGPNPYELKRMQEKERQTESKMPGVLALGELSPAERAAVIEARRSQDVEYADIGAKGAAITGAGLGGLAGFLLGSRFGGGKLGMLGAVVGAGGGSAIASRMYRSRTRDAQEEALESDTNRRLPMSQREKDIRTMGLPQGVGETAQQVARSRLIGGEDADTLEPKPWGSSLREEFPGAEDAPTAFEDLEPTRFWRKEAVLREPEQFVPVGPDNDVYKVIARSPEDALLVDPKAFYERFVSAYPERAQQAEQAVAELVLKDKNIEIPGISGRKFSYDQLVAVGSSPDSPADATGSVPPYLREVLRLNPTAYAKMAKDDPALFRARGGLDAATLGILPDREFLGVPPKEYETLSRYGGAYLAGDGSMRIDPSRGVHALLKLRIENPAGYQEVMREIMASEAGNQAP